MSKKTGIIIGIIVGILAIIAVGLVLPAKYHIERSVFIKGATPRIVHSYVNNISNWPKWMIPVEVQDAIEYSYEGPAEGVGAKQYWKTVGARGFNIITRSDPNRGIWIDSAFMSNDITNSSSLTYEAFEGGTRVTCTSEGEVMRIISTLYLDAIEDRLGDYYEYALTRLKQIIEYDLKLKTARDQKESQPEESQPEESQPEESQPEESQPEEK